MASGEEVRQAILDGLRSTDVDQLFPDAGQTTWDIFNKLQESEALTRAEHVHVIAFYFWETQTIPYGYRFSVAHDITDYIFEVLSPVGNEHLDGIILP